MAKQQKYMSACEKANQKIKESHEHNRVSVMEDILIEMEVIEERIAALYEIKNQIKTLIPEIESASQPRLFEIKNLLFKLRQQR